MGVCWCVCVGSGGGIVCSVGGVDVCVGVGVTMGVRGEWICAQSRGVWMCVGNGRGRCA